MVNRTSSHTWGRWYLPMFLFRDGLLTPLYNAFYSSNEVLVFPPHYAEIFYCGGMTYDVIVVMYWGASSVLWTSPKCCWGLSNIFFMAFHPVTFVSIYDPTVFGDGVFVFGSHQDAFDGFASSKVHLYAMFSTYIHKGSNLGLWCMVQPCEAFWCWVWGAEFSLEQPWLLPAVP